MIYDKCGLFGIFGSPRAAHLAYFGLYALQHRGQESSGIVTGGNGMVHIYKGMGEVSTVFADRSTLDRLKGRHAIGHTRYSTTGASSLTNIQPLLITNRSQKLAIGHNGNLTNTRELYEKLIDNGAIFQTTLDSEIIVHLIAMSRKETFEERLVDALSHVEGAYCLVILTKDKVIAARDPHGFRPLCIGKTESSWAVASESCALDIIGSRHFRDVEPGEIIIIDDAGLHLSFHDDEGKVTDTRVLEVDNVVVCAGQESVRDLVDPLTIAGISTHVIGGADVAAELDAKRAIRQGTEVAAGLG